MPRPRPQSIALAPVVPNLISQLRVAQSRQRIRRNKLSFPRRPPFTKSSNPTLPLPRRPACLIKQRPEHALHISLRSSQRLFQIDILPLLRRQCEQLPVLPHINSGDPRRLPIPSLKQPSRSHVLRHAHSLLRPVLDLLHRIRALIFLAFSRRVRRLFPRCLSRILRRILSRILWRLAALRPRRSRAHHHQQTHHHQSTASPVPSTRNLSHSANTLSANSAAFLGELCPHCRTERAFFAQREPALSEAEGNLGEPRVVSRSLRHDNCAFG